MNPVKVLVEGDSETICEDTLRSLDLLDKWYAYDLENIENLRNILLGIPELDFEESDIWSGPGRSYIYSKVLYRNRRRLREHINRAFDELISAHGLVKKKFTAQRTVVEPRSTEKNDSSLIASKSNLEFEQAVLDLLKPDEQLLYSTQIASINKNDDLSKLVDGKKFIARIADWNSSPSVWTFFYCIEISDGSQSLIQERRSGNMVGGNVRRLSTKETAYSLIINFRADEVVRRKILAREIFQIGRPNKVDMSFLGTDLETAFNDLRARTELNLRSINVDPNVKQTELAGLAAVEVEQIEKLALGLLQWVALDIKPMGGYIRSRSYANSILPGLLTICEKYPREVVQWLNANGHLPAVVSVVKHLEREVDIKHLEDRIKKKNYSGAYPAPAMMMAADSYILNVSRSFIGAADSICVREIAVENVKQIINQKLTVVKRNSGAKKLVLLQNLPLGPQKSIKHTDVFSSSLVRNTYRKVVEDFAEKFAIDSKTSFLGSMLSSRRVTTWNFPDGNITQSDGSWGHRASMHVSTAGLRARILLHVGVDLSKTRVYREFGLPNKDLQFNVIQTPSWQLVASGYWYEDTYHSGHIAYFLAKTGPQEWTMESVERNALLDGITQEDVDEGRLNDDQIQAMWGSTLEEAQNSEYRQVVCVYADGEIGSKPEDIAAKLYRQVCDSGGKEIDEFDSTDGLLE